MDTGSSGTDSEGQSLSSKSPTPRDRFWTTFFHTKIHACYLALLLERTSATNTRINVAAAVLGCGAAAAFLKSFQVGWLFGMLSLLSGGLLAAKPYLPYRHRMKALGAAAHEYEEHLIWAEKKWPEVDGAGQDVIELRSELQRRTEKTLHRHFPDTHVPDVPKLMQRATAHALAHFRTYYGSVIQ